MSHVLAIASREVRSLFSTPVAYVLLAGYMVLAGYFFFLGLGSFLQWIQQLQAFQMFDMLQQANVNEHIIGPSLGTFSFFFILVIPLVTMRVFSEERANGTFELLLTAPIATWQIVLGKYLAVVCMVALLELVSAAYPLLLLLYGNPELLQTLAGLLGLFLYGCVLGAIGCFASALTRSQMVAGVIALAAGLVMYLLEYLAQLAPAGWTQEAIRWLAVNPHLEPTVRGLVQTEDLAYFALTAAFALWLTRTAVESLRWR